METVLIVGATGNIGVSTAIAALRTKRNVLAVVRSEASAEKLFKHVGTRDGITTVQADVTSDQGVQGVVDQVKAGKLPAFQHVYSCVGGDYVNTPLTKISTEYLRQQMNRSFETNFFAYRATLPYLLEQNNPNSTWTLCTGAQGDMGNFAMPAMTQGALFSMAAAAAVETKGTNVRFNEVYLAFRVEVDEDAAQHDYASRASDFAAVYEGLLARPDIQGARVNVFSEADFKELKVVQKGLNLGGEDSSKVSYQRS
ncbi:hypothetical protein JX265_009655 [Neoarthrinium moseri]|uniref:Uncharacterized protein n=1 Tax=Neoarthrinium moseri TaxID=1658444 RepID=A0A9Q0AMC9_9PEZI|nr:hypothetical protein JX265_009655 [Neoarthrinium moseri]